MKRFIIAMAILWGAQALWGQSPLVNLAGPENAALLGQGEKLVRLQQKDPVPVLVPRDPYIKGMVERTIRDLDPGFFVETLRIYRKPAFNPGSPRWTAVERTGLYNQLLALSSLAGLQYYSASRKKMRVFYETSTVVSGPDGKTPRPDPVYANPPGELTIYARQKDLSFGDNIYRYDYYARPDSLVFIQENITSMNYGIIPAVSKNKLRSLVVVCDAGDCLLIYAVSMAKAASVPGLNDRISASFTNRAEAVLDWFNRQADKVFRK
ncbi:MAG: hypothetical protein LBC31_07675 [Treponema sp.]|jgi:hypothetical protein|nr:hypothetical protein [Treponema sp.]